MSEHFLITIDHGHLRIYGESKTPHRLTPDLHVLDARDFLDAAQASSGAKQPARDRSAHARRRGLSLRQQVPLKRERGIHHGGTVSAELNEFLRRHPHASWDFAAPPRLYGSVMEALAPDARRRLKRVLAKDLVRRKPEEVRAHFALAAAG